MKFVLQRVAEASVSVDGEIISKYIKTIRGLGYRLEKQVDDGTKEKTGKFPDIYHKPFSGNADICGYVRVLSVFCFELCL